MLARREANLEFLHRRQKQLREHGSALKWLLKQGLRERTISNFGLGLSGEYSDKEKIPHANALLAPVLNESGVFTNQTIYLNIPRVTLNPAQAAGWMRGAARTYYGEKYETQPMVIVFENVFDVWLAHQFLNEAESDFNILLICSTPNDFPPEEWRETEFWRRFETIYLALSNTASGDKKAIEIAQLAGCETRRLRPPLNFGKDWTEFWQAGGTVKEFYRIISDAGIIGAEVSSDTGDSSILGRFGYKPVDITTAFHRGHLYYPVKTVVNSLDSFKNRQGDASLQFTSRTEVVVVRSDRTIHTVSEEAAPRGTPPEDRILRLTDGTLIESRPKASIYSTWSWNSIDTYRQNRSKPRSLKKILRDIKDFLRRSVWLPYSYDYDLLTLLVPVTYAQAVFQSVPMILVTGPPASGKSALGRAMCRICANAVSVGQISAAAVARLISETKGFVLMDDLESIGKRSKGDSAHYGELVQALKLSYNKDTSWKIWTDVSRGMRVERLNFFGVKMINNTTGADSILGSRMLKIYTEKIPTEFEMQPGANNSEISQNLDFLRDELHTWTFENVALIDATYKRLFPHPSDRSAEISAPLRVFAAISGNEELSLGLETALKAKDETIKRVDDPIEVMIMAVKNLVRAGYSQISTTHVVLEMKILFKRNNPNRSYPVNLQRWEKPAWVGRQLRTYRIIDINTASSRQWLFGKSLRVYPLRQDFVRKILSENQTPSEYLKKQPLDFCKGCRNCAYNNADCPFMSSRLTAEKLS